jgi:rhamnogalacturonyl hydrolase YesR
MTRPIHLKETIEQSLRDAISWVQRNEYRGYEPADGNLSWMFSLTGGRVFPMRVLQQVVLRAPFNIRPLLGISPHESAIGRGYMAWGYLLMNRLHGNDNMHHEAIACFKWLMVNRSSRSTEFCWGDPYEYASRGGRRPYGEPLLIWSALIGLAFLDAYELYRDEQYLRIAESTGNWMLTLPREHTGAGSCLSYVVYRQSSIHNSNAMGAAFLARLGSITKNPEALSAARSAMAYTCARQRSDGSWYYGEEFKYHWVDNFHTGYNLSALKSYRDATKDDSFDKSIERGLLFYKAHFFEANGRPKYFHDKRYPIDIQCAAQAIETLATVADDNSECLALAMKVAEWTIDNMQAKDGHFFYRDLGWKKVRTPMLHWGQGTMVKALAVLMNKLALPQGSAIAVTPS